LVSGLGISLVSGLVVGLVDGLVDDVVDDVVDDLIDAVVSGWRHSMEAWLEGIAGWFAPKGFAQRPSRTAGGSGARMRLGLPTIGTWWKIPGLDGRVQ
jgi:hypothetical protein